MEVSSAADHKTWDAWFDGPAVSPDFMQSRGQPGQDKREATLEWAPKDEKQP